MNLRECVPTQKAKAVTIPKHLVDIKKERLATIKALAPLLAKRELVPSVVAVTSALVDDFNDEVSKFIDENTKNSTSLKSKLSKLVVGASYANYAIRETTVEPTAFAESPIVDMQEIHKLAAACGMIILPFAYLNEESFKGERYDVRGQISKFDAAATELGMTSYVVCPIRHYSIINHLRHSDLNLEIIAGSNQVHFDSLAMTLPLLVMLDDRVANLNDRVTVLEKKTSNLQAGVDSLNVRLDRLTKEVEKQVREQAEARVQAANTRATFEWFQPYDPLMFAVSGSITSASVARLGPCWGPDLPVELVAALGLAKTN